jgi:hypothetical protein
MTADIPSTDDLGVAKIAAAMSLISVSDTYELVDTTLDDRLRMFIHAYEVITAAISEPQRARNLLAD